MWLMTGHKNAPVYTARVSLGKVVENAMPRTFLTEESVSKLKCAWNQKRQRVAPTARLGDANNVASAQRRRDSLALNRRRRVELALEQRRQCVAHTHAIQRGRWGRNRALALDTNVTQLAKRLCLVCIYNGVRRGDKDILLHGVVSRGQTHTRGTHSP